MKKNRLLRASILAAALFIGLQTAAVAALSSPLDRGGAIRVTVDDQAADAVLAIADQQASSGAVTEDAWNALFRTSGYRDLKAREEAMRRPFSDDDFRSFAVSDAVVGRRDELRATLAQWKGHDVAAAAARALRYLPAGATIEAVVYPLIKPKPNSFVFKTDRGYAIFLYLDPAVPGAKFENIVVHELHHIGYANACPSPDTSTAAGRARKWAGGFGEGLAMLAAAGGAAVHPHATSDGAERAVWERDVQHVARDIERLEEFFLGLASGRLSDDSEIRTRFMSFISSGDVPQGAFYTVGWQMAAAIEAARGRDALVAALCSPAALLALYNDVVADTGAPRWSDEVIEALAAPSP